MLLAGGNNEEREVSIASAKEIGKNLDRNKYEVEELMLANSETYRVEDFSKLFECRPEMVFLGLHGVGFEDGKIQGMLESLGYKYNGSGVLASALGMNKLLMKRLVEGVGVKVPRLDSQIPCVVKPVGGGSSVGVTLVKKKEYFSGAVEKARKFGEVMVEEYIKGREVSVGVVGNEELVVLPPIEIRPKNDFFDYEAKYVKGGSEEICPSSLPKNVLEKMGEEAKIIYRLVGCRGYARLDFIVAGDVSYFLEINTLPGMTPTSLLPQEARVYGWDYGRLLDEIIRLAME